jgi:hypothetical protein
MHLAISRFAKQNFLGNLAKVLKDNHPFSGNALKRQLRPMDMTRL